jgi:Rad3-related DNA helicase
MKNRFPVENRPIYVRSAGRITGGPAKMHEWADNLVDKADEILDEYKHDRGIIHTHNFAIADLLMTKSRHKCRFLYQRNFRTKEAMLGEHSSRENGVIVAPAMHEGLDLYGELSRVQLICKVPWPNFMDNKQLTRRMELDYRYYLWLTALKLIQSSGRSIRSEDDWAHTYVLDEVFYRFMRDARSMIPTWFKDAVEFGESHISTYKSVKRPLIKVVQEPIERVLNLD